MTKKLMTELKRKKEVKKIQVIRKALVNANQSKWAAYGYGYSLYGNGVQKLDKYYVNVTVKTAKGIPASYLYKTNKRGI